jgi:hypothetical protein
MDAVEHALRAFTGGPAHVMDRYFNIIAVNDVARVLLRMNAGDNLARLLFLSDESPALFADWDTVAARFVAAARLGYRTKTGDPAFESLIADVRARSEHFARLWDAGDLGSPFGQIVRVCPPGSDVITLTWVVFPLPDTAEHVLVISPAVDDVSTRRIAALMEQAANAH